MKKGIVILAFILLSVGVFGRLQTNEKKDDSPSNLQNAEKITFSGEAEYWKAAVVTKVSDGSNGTDFTLRVEYKGDLEDLKDIYLISYTYKFGTQEGKRSENHPEGLSSKKSVVYEDHSRTNTTSIDKKTVIPFKIEWNDKIEEFELIAQ